MSGIEIILIRIDRDLCSGKRRRRGKRRERTGEALENKGMGLP